MDATHLTATVTTDAREGGCAGGRAFADYDVRVVVLAGAGIDAVAEINDDGEVRRIDGTYPRAMERALIEIAEAAVADDGEGTSAWTVDAAGEVAFVEPSALAA